MAKYKEIVSMVLDEIKSLGGDSFITEDHVIFLAKHYRTLLLSQKIEKQGIWSLSHSNTQTICVNLDKTGTIEDLDYCGSLVLKSDDEIPDTINNIDVTVKTDDLLAANVTMVTKARFKFVGHNKYMTNIIYCMIDDDKHLYVKSSNPQFKYLKKIKVSGVFEDTEKAAEKSCETSDSSCDILESEYPLDSELIPQLIQMCVKELSGALWRQGDNINNSRDDLADLMAYIRNNTKNNMQKQIQGE